MLSEQRDYNRYEYQRIGEEGTTTVAGVFIGII